ncbi:short subunit dehydrogenase [Glaciihabitans tibetensis]|uniref:Short subunit dehydrogenase n=1 Tax=Glaciihabitans tibetensis TaxID=1266600 RepID=A0A2T0VD18_9MICO|nr:SDR family NAD(P)-dependent oxidoreductase [Glaciihabitans tibetensis]PRY68067.1 short subunit dehydrogenase [Glaciihabitans tibetensis]
MIGRIVVIAGASSAAGRAAASALSARGERVVAVGSNADRLRDVAAAAHYVCDLSRAEDVHALANQIRSEVGAPDGLVHLVGGWRAGQDEEGWLWLERQLVTTLRNTTLAFRDDLTASPAGRLAVVSATAVDSPTWSNANYATAKTAAEAWVAAIGSGWAKANTAAAVRFVVRSIGDGDGATSVTTLADAIAGLWDAPAYDLNRARVYLTGR